MAVKLNTEHIFDIQFTKKVPGSPMGSIDDVVREKPNDEFSFHEAMELTGNGCFNWLALLGCTLIFFHSMIEMLAMAYALDPVECDFELTGLQKSLIGSAIFIGIVATSIFWGVLCDVYGRKMVMLPALFATVIMSFISSISQNYLTMFITRLLTGALVSAYAATILVYLGELYTDKYRDTAISVAITMVSVAFIFVPGVAWLIIPNINTIKILNWYIKSWQIYMWTFGIVGLIGAFILCCLPESPSFVFSQQGPDAALLILTYIHGYNHTGAKKVDYPVRKILPLNQQRKSPCQEACDGVIQLMKSPMRRPFLIVHFCMFMVFFLASGVYMWMPGIFNLVLQNTTLPWNVCTALTSKYKIEEPLRDYTMNPHVDEGGMDCKTGEINTMVYIVSIVFEILLLVPVVIIALIIEKCHKGLLYALVMFPCAIGLALCVHIPQISIATIALTMGICSAASASILSAVVVNAFPISLRALVMCTMFMMGQVGAVLGNTLVGVASHGPCMLVFSAMAGLVFASILSFLIFWPNISKLKKTMEERNFSF